MALERPSDEQLVAQYSNRGPKMTTLVTKLLTEIGGAKLSTPVIPEGQTHSDAIDAAFASEAAELAAAMSELQANREVAVREMLDRIRAGTYGECTRCLKPIPLDRLYAIPEAKLCMPCKVKSE
jgi:RNA polymerase-binding transcription factor DksA